MISGRVWRGMARRAGARWDFGLARCGLVGRGFWAALSGAVFLLLTSCTGFRYGNDILRPGGKDRYLTSDATFEFKDGWSLKNEVRTPTEKESQEVQHGDMPYDGALLIEKKVVRPVGWGEENVFRYRAGGIGKLSFSKEIQQGVHDLLTDLGKPQSDPTWIGQHKGEVAGEVIASRRSREYLQSLVGDSRVTTEHGVRVGNIAIEAFLDQELRKHFWKYWDVFGGFTGKAVAFNSMVEGRMFRDDVHEENIQHLVAIARVGFEYKKDDFAIGYTIYYLTEEMENQPGRHSFNAINVSWGW